MQMPNIGDQDTMANLLFSVNETNIAQCMKSSFLRIRYIINTVIIKVLLQSCLSAIKSLFYTKNMEN